MQTSVQAAGGGKVTSRGQTASRPPVGRDGRGARNTVSQNMGNSAVNHPDTSISTPADSAQNRNTVQPAAQNGGRNTVSTEARRASSPSAARPMAQARMAQTAGMVQNARQSGAKPNSAANLPSAGNAGNPPVGRHTADSALLHPNPADIRSSVPTPASQTVQGTNTAQSASRTEHTAYSESVSVRQSQTSGRPPMPNGTTRPGTAGNNSLPRAPIHGGGALRQDGTTEGRQSRPDVVRQEVPQTGERILTQEAVKMTGQMHNQTRMQTAPISGSARSASVKGDVPRPPSGREPVRGAAVQKVVRGSAPEKGLKVERTGRGNAIPSREHSPNEHRQSPAAQSRNMVQRQKQTAASPPRNRQGDERK